MRSVKRVVALAALALACGMLGEEARSAPAAPWSAMERARLRSELTEALAPAGSSSWERSCIVFSNDGSVLYADRSDRALVPASVQKLIVADAALAAFGRRYRFDTLFAATPPRAGVIGGELWLAGSGDPSLRSSDLQRGVSALRSLGITRVQRVATDGSAIAGPELNPHWNISDANEDFMAPTSGVSLDEDTVEFHVTGALPGHRALVWINPATPAVSYSGTVQTGSGDDVVIAGTATPNRFRIYGVIPPGVSNIFYLPVHDVPHYAGIVLTSVLRRAGIAVAQPPIAGRAPLESRALWEHRSAPLSKLLRHMMVFSDNHFAEQLLRALGGMQRGRSDDAHGLLTERSILKAQHIPTPGLQLVDGSGLAGDNRVAAVTLARILRQVDLYALLPRAGIDGTLKWYHFRDAKGHVRAKSGHLAAVSALAGYVETRRHGRIVFAFIINGSRSEADAAIVAAVDRLARH